MLLSELVEQVSGFDTAAPKDKIRLLAWWLHTHGGKELLTAPDIRGCFDKLHLDEPPALATYLNRMAEAKELLKERNQYKLNRSARTELDKKYGVHHSIVAVSKLLADLPSKVPNVIERDFLNEALKCYRIEAYRSCIVMTWNLAYSHLLEWLLSDPNRLSVFNAAIVRRYQKKTNVSVATYDDFSEKLTEREVIEICNTGTLFNSGIFKILKEKLDRRNTAAHPSSIVVVQSQADDMITNLVNNVVLALT